MPATSVIVGGCSLNDGERDLRPAKTQQIISGRLRSEQATRHRYAICGYLSTATKHGINMLAALRDSLEGHPSMPPIPDPHNLADQPHHHA